LENNYFEIKSDLSKTMEELRHYKQGMHESENMNKEKQQEIDSLKETIKTLNSNMIDVKSN
jgi:cell division FtsZ-interacting protein ZapD